LPLILLAFGSLVHDWSVFYNQGFYEDPSEWVRPVWNLQLLNSLLVCAIFGFTIWVQHSDRFPSALPPKNLYRQILRFVVPGVLLLSIYYSFRMEIEYYFRMRNFELMEGVDRPDIVNTNTFIHAGSIWVIYYSMIFLGLLSWVNMRWIRDRILGIINLGLNTFGILMFLVGGLFSLGFLDDAYTITDEGELVLHTGLSYLRYVGYLLLAALLYTTYRYQREDFIPIRSRWPFDALLHLTALITLSVELVHLITQAGAPDADKLGLSIFWGVYSLFLIALGIAQRKTYLRISAIVLFAVTLFKLFFYDIAHLTTMAKTVVLLSLGVLLLLISFLYNKFKHFIADEPNA